MTGLLAHTRREESAFREDAFDAVIERNLRRYFEAEDRILDEMARKLREQG